ncbi:DUF1559 domain-containing protein [Rhodopirellula sp.]|nr:DUF1559 domain-containing protein [Rhodopirellula sp.]MDA7915393.1 DUF1559 domain-containing protein [bacterium]
MNPPLADHYDPSQLTTRRKQQIKSNPKTVIILVRLNPNLHISSEHKRITTNPESAVHMKTNIRTPLFLMLVVAACCLLGTTRQALAQQEKKSIGNAFLPADAAATVIMRVSDTLSSPKAELYPIEVINAWCLQNIGMSAEDIDTVQVVAATPGPTGPMFAAVIRLKQDFNLAKVNSEMVNANDPIDVDGKSCFPINSPFAAVLHEYDSKTVVLATTNYIDTVLRAGTDDRELGPLAKLADTTTASGQLSLLASMEPVRPLVMSLLQNADNQIPPPLQDLIRLPKMVDSVVLSIDIESENAGQRLTMFAPNAATAKELQRSLMNGILTARDMILQVATAGMDNNDPIAAASQQYMKRLADRTVEAVTPTQSGREVVMKGTLDYSMTTNGVLVGMLLPAVQSARAAARRMSSMNNMKQIGLAMHNHHAAYRKLPGNIVDPTGKPLLSWRVKILPFIDQQNLYQQFHLDEPWDSEHNITLVNRMPNIYAHPEFANKPGMTIYQRPRGPKLIMNSDTGRSFREILDGTSNTIMAVETPPNAAVAWTKPEDISISLDNPKSKLFETKRLGINVLMGDGAVRFLGNDLDASTLKSILTAQGGEVLDRSKF